MSFGISLSNWVVMLVFLLGLLSNANAQTINSSTEDFETNDFSKFPWEHPGDASWTITSYENNSGTYSARAGTIDHRERATLRVTLDCVSGDITFYRKVSSESDFDYLEFYIDSVEMDKWSGEEDWAEVSFPVRGGKRTFEWTYSKDGSESGGNDTAWIDDIVFPVGGTTGPTGIPFKRGVNLCGWFQYSSVRQIQFTKFTKQDLISIKSLGCDVIRLPIELHSMTNGEPDYTIDPLFYYFLDQIIDWAEELELHLILDNHSSTGPTDPSIGDILVPVWTQMAQHYKDRSTYLYYEVLNEPREISDTTWNEIQQKVIDAIRAVDQKHTIIIGPAGWGSYNNLKFMPEYDDNNLIYTFHFYDPFLFTHQGASWPIPSLVPLAGVPFPYDAARMPDCPPELQNTWLESNFTNYRNTATVEHVKELIDIAVDFQTARNVPLFCGEFGVLMLNSNNEDRIYWHSVVRSYLEQKGIAWTIWDYTGIFGLFEQGTSALFDYDLNIPIVEALGLNAPPQQEFILVPDVSEFDIYMDHIAPNIIESSLITKGILDYYSQDKPASGDFCIHWTGVGQYNSIAFRFSPVKDLSLLVDEGFAIDFWIRCDIPDAKIDIRFVDTKTEDPVDHPWRMRYTIDRNVAVWDGRWNHLQIPLNEFFEHGSWDNDRWYNPVGAFDWTATERFEIVSEHSDLEGIHFYFDNIRVVEPNPPVVPEPPVDPNPPDGFDLYLDDIAPDIIESGPPQEGILDYYSEDNPASGDYCIHWTGVNQYNSIAFRFSPVKDLSMLVDEGFAIDFWVRCNSPNAKIDIRFVDNKTEDPVDHPWRMRYTIDRNVAVWDGRWNHLQIPLNAFSEHGSWDDGWYNPVGAFDWTATELFEIVSEYGDLEGIHFYFDDIRVLEP